MEKKYTKGPWHLGGDDNFDCIEVMYDDSRIFIAKVPSGYTDRDGLANAHLIAASPDLLESGEKQTDVIKRCQSHMVNFLKLDGLTKEQFVNAILGELDGPEQREAQTAWDAAIAKAYGKAN